MHSPYTQIILFTSYPISSFNKRQYLFLKCVFELLTYWLLTPEGFMRQKFHLHCETKHFTLKLPENTGLHLKSARGTLGKSRQSLLCVRKYSITGVLHCIVVQIVGP